MSSQFPCAVGRNASALVRSAEFDYVSHLAALSLGRPSLARCWFGQLRGDIDTNALNFRYELEPRFGKAVLTAVQECLVGGDVRPRLPCRDVALVCNNGLRMRYPLDRQFLSRINYLVGDGDVRNAQIN